MSRLGLRTLMFLLLVAGIAEAGLFKRRCAPPVYGPETVPPGLRPYADEIHFNKVDFTKPDGSAGSGTVYNNIGNPYVVKRSADITIEATLNYDPGNPVTSFAAAYEVGMVDPDPQPKQADAPAKVNGKALHVKHFKGLRKSAHYDTVIVYTIAANSLAPNKTYHIFLTDPPHWANTGPIVVSTVP